MKKYFLYLAAICLIAACKNNDGTSNQPTKDNNILASGMLTINGNLAGLDSGYKGFIHLKHEEEGVTITDSVPIANGAFTFKDSLTEPTFFNLEIPESDEIQPFQFFADPGTLSLTGRVDSLQKSKLLGSKTNDEFSKALANLTAIYDKANAYYDKYSAAKAKGDTEETNRIEKFFDGLTTEANQYIANYASTNPNSLVAAYLISINFNDEKNIAILKPAFDGMSEMIKSSRAGKHIQTLLDAKKQTQPGAALNFTQEDVNGKPFNLASLKGKYVLVDFWASWCGPCRGENPNVVKAYNDFKGKGFDILGVSLDEDKADWLAAIKKDKLTWHHVSDLKGWQNAIAQQFKIESIPANFLLDKEGKIIGKDLRGEELQQKLKDILK